MTLPDPRDAERPREGWREAYEKASHEGIFYIEGWKGGYLARDAEVARLRAQVVEAVDAAQPVWSGEVARLRDRLSSSPPAAGTRRKYSDQEVAEARRLNRMVEADELETWLRRYLSQLPLDQDVISKLVDDILRHALDTVSSPPDETVERASRAFHNEYPNGFTWDYLRDDAKKNDIRRRMRAALAAAPSPPATAGVEELKLPEGCEIILGATAGTVMIQPNSYGDAQHIYKWLKARLPPGPVLSNGEKP